MQHLLQVFPREQVLLLRYRELKDAPAATLDRVCDFLGVRTGVLREIPKENVNRHVVEDNGVNRVLRGLLRAGGQFGHRFPVPLRLAARGPILTLLHRKTGARPVTTPAGARRAAAAVRRRHRAAAGGHGRALRRLALRGPTRQRTRNPHLARR